MIFIIHSKLLYEEALKYEKAIGEKCYIPLRDTPQENPDVVLQENYNGMKKCSEVRVLWNGESFGSMFDMGMAYALGIPIKPILCKGEERWRQYFKFMIRKKIIRGKDE